MAALRRRPGGHLSRRSPPITAAELEQLAAELRAPHGARELELEIRLEASPAELERALALLAWNNGGEFAAWRVSHAGRSVVCIEGGRFDLIGRD